MTVPEVSNCGLPARPIICFLSAHSDPPTHLYVDIRILLETSSWTLPSHGTFDDDRMGWEIDTDSQG